MQILCHLSPEILYRNTLRKRTGEESADAGATILINLLTYRFTGKRAIKTEVMVVA